MTTRQYKKLKGLKKENLRDNMSTMEIVLNMLAEAKKDTGRPVITSQNAAQLNAVVVDMIESVAETEKLDNDENK